MNRVGIIIQVRLSSTRLPNKALLPIGNKPLLLRLVEHLAPLKDLGEIIIATTREPSDEAIVEFAQENNIACYRGSLEDSLARFVGAAEKYKKDIIVRVTGDNPLTEPSAIRLAVDTLLKENLEYVATKGLPLGTNAEVTTLEALKKINSLQLVAIHRESITSYLYTNPDRYRCKIVEIKDEKVHRPNYRLTIDTEEDLLLHEKIYQAIGDNPTLEKTVQLLDSKRELLEINSAVEQKRLELD